ncbi:Hypp5664 [Branchiostoma lanceolatum]|uniref:WW domain binding protein VOPP1 n=1 Tax=Branchiostoma lanceolatum TaxID=7740 RepID=A0A8J9YQS5_BRALA|nr:Hypp5664 [Branchiostoma lanceolatum]
MATRTFDSSANKMAATGHGHLTAIFFFFAATLSKIVDGNEYCRTSRDGYVTYYSCFGYCCEGVWWEEECCVIISQLWYFWIGLFSGAVVLLALLSLLCWRLKRKSRVEVATVTDGTESDTDLRSRTSITNNRPAHFIQPPPYDPKNYYNDPPPAYPGSPSPPPEAYHHDPHVPLSPPPSGASPPPPYLHPTEDTGQTLPGQIVQDQSSEDAST